MKSVGMAKISGKSIRKSILKKPADKDAPIDLDKSVAAKVKAKEKAKAVMKRMRKEKESAALQATVDFVEKARDSQHLSSIPPPSSSRSSWIPPLLNLGQAQKTVRTWAQVLSAVVGSHPPEAPLGSRTSPLFILTVSIPQGTPKNAGRKKVRRRHERQGKR